MNSANFTGHVPKNDLDQYMTNTNHKILTENQHDITFLIFSRSLKITSYFLTMKSKDNFVWKKDYHSKRKFVNKYLCIKSDIYGKCNVWEMLSERVKAWPTRIAVQLSFKSQPANVIVIPIIVCYDESRHNITCCKNLLSKIVAFGMMLLFFLGAIAFVNVIMCFSI